jgi:sugar (pentulose or hexulose) kinase
MKYHKWLKKEGIIEKLPPLHYGKDVIKQRDGLAVGVGLHDSSSAIIPYTINFTEPFVLLSTGTWSISLNPFNNKPLTFEELQQDCLCYMQYTEKPVKAARLFSGNEHEIQAKRLAEHFNVPFDTFKDVYFDKKIVSNLRALNFQIVYPKKYENDILKECPFQKRDLSTFKSYDIAYHQLMLDLVEQQVFSTNLVIHNSPVKKIFVDGGFSKNSIFMNLLAEAFPDVEVYAASMAQASALGAALAIHQNWNPKPIQNDLIDLKFYKH